MAHLTVLVSAIERFVPLCAELLEDPTAMAIPSSTPHYSIDLLFDVVAPQIQEIRMLVLYNRRAVSIFVPFWVTMKT